MPTLLTIAGFDPSSGAGISADLATFAAHGCFGTACITALTVQSTTGVRDVVPVGEEHVVSTLRCLEEDLPADGIKIGMLADAVQVAAVAEFLEQSLGTHSRRPVVLDPVLRSSSGRVFLDARAVEVLHARLLPRVNWVTPNVHELCVLTHRPSLVRSELLFAARELQQSNPHLGVVVTGGHMEPPDDLLVPAQAPAAWIGGKPHLATQSTHGTGCAFSSAFLSNLVLRSDSSEAARLAKDYVYRAIESAPGLGRGHGPLNHLWTRPLEKDLVRP